MSETKPMIGVLDDEPKMCIALRRLLKTHNFRVVTFVPVPEFLAFCASSSVDCLLLDLHMPGINGFEVLKHFAAKKVPIPVIVITGYDAPGNAERVKALGAVAYLLKPLNEEQLIATIRKAIEVRRNDPALS